jgi:arylsulfatase A-like enzyme
MSKEFKGIINVDIRDSVPDWTPYEAPKAPEGAPNVLYIVWDDVGFAALSPFGGLIETPAMDRVAEMGLRYTNWHTTALCSPTRSCLLTGRNAHMNGMACIGEATTGFPGKNGHIPFENATIAEVLLDQGYNTYMLGKWHLCPEDEYSMASTKRNWPVGRGFERYYGFLGGETNQWYPDLVYDNHFVEQPYSPEEGYHLDRDLADKAIGFIADAKQIAPDKPFFMYYCPGTAHAPHHAPKEWIEKYEGVFDMGYERYRDVVLERQKEMGIVAPDTEVSAINPMEEGRYFPVDYVKPWDGLPDDEKRLFARMAEVYAGFVSHADYQIGRVIDYLEEIGQLDNTIIIVTSDNGASGEGGTDGSVNENKFFNSWPDSLEENMKFLDVLGGPETYNHYPTGWAMAFNTPYKMFKRYTYNGGIADPCIISWPKGIKAQGSVRDQYHHAIDIVPTVLDLLNVEMPEVVKGYPQTPIQGVSMAYSFDDPDVPSERTLQYYEMLGMRGIYQDGWKAVTDRGPAPIGLGFKEDGWELYHVEEDRAEIHNLADQHPDKLEELVGLWWHEAGINKVLPLDDRTAIEILTTPRPEIAPPRDSYTYYPHTTEVPEAAAVNIRNRSFTILAEVEIETPEAEGVIFAHGSRFGGHALFIKGGKLYYANNFIGMEETKFVSSQDVPTGKLVLGAEFTKTHEEPRGVANGILKLYVNDEVVAEGELRTQPGKFTLSGEGLVVGRDSADAVSKEYRPPFEFTGGAIKNVTVNVSGEHYVDLELEAIAMMKRD